MQILVNSKVILNAFTIDDIPQLAERINHKSIADMTLSIPFPYTLDDAELFINQSLIQDQGAGQRNWAIRHQASGLIGGIGMQLKYGLDSHKDEIGYWLTPEYWSNGIMTRIVERFVNHLAEYRKLKRIEAPVFANNYGSAKVLEKNYFEKEGVLRKSYYKNGQYLDAHLYSKILD